MVGLAVVYNRYQRMAYGYCMRAFCDKQPVIPIGMSDVLRKGRVKIYCPKCEEVYVPSPQRFNMDGAFFGPSLPHIFLKEYRSQIVLPPVLSYYEPQVRGFKIAGKRGSKLFEPCREDVLDTMELQRALKNRMLASVKNSNNL